MVTSNKTSGGSKKDILPQSEKFALGLVWRPAPPFTATSIVWRRRGSSGATDEVEVDRGVGDKWFVMNRECGPFLNYKTKKGMYHVMEYCF